MDLFVSHHALEYVLVLWLESEDYHPFFSIILFDMHYIHAFVFPQAASPTNIGIPLGEHSCRVGLWMFMAMLSDRGGSERGGRGSNSNLCICIVYIYICVFSLFLSIFCSYYAYIYIYICTYLFDYTYASTENSLHSLGLGPGWAHAVRHLPAAEGCAFRALPGVTRLGVWLSGFRD